MMDAAPIFSDALKSWWALALLAQEGGENYLRVTATQLEDLFVDFNLDASDDIWFGLHSAGMDFILQSNSDKSEEIYTGRARMFQRIRARRAGSQAAPA